MEKNIKTDDLSIKQLIAIYLSLIAVTWWPELPEPLHGPTHVP